MAARDSTTPNRRLLLIRHGESVANVSATAAESAGLEVIPLTQRDADVPLSPLGEQQAMALRSHLQSQLPHEARVWSSPYLRATQTARFALGDDASFAVDERLRDRELGIIDGLTAHGVEVRLPAEAARRRWQGRFYYRPAGGEAWTDVVLRIRSFSREVDWSNPGPVVIFAHDAVVSLFLYAMLRFTETDLDTFLRTRLVGNASVTTLTGSQDQSWSVETFGDARRLTALGVPATQHPGTSRDETP